ncbi:hypothetical protein NQ318_019427 [Aromia moschata]|uniref:tRNA-queuosine alpha-mannosyltransferase n=1 Tax=Aromia moschata TaxID=1265417 RepID=A0AAV8Y1N3_9CUCU|nr:hypothetical protein NQ318_019427 [Aromia moschata]
MKHITPLSPLRQRNGTGAQDAVPYSYMTKSLGYPPESVLFCSSVLNLSELLGLRPDLSKLKKIVYFHENQLVYPVQHIKERDIQFAYNQITTRWEFDKAPDDFFQVMLRLKQDKFQFRLSVLGETYTDVPDIFKRAKDELREEIINFGYLDSKDDYVKALSSSHVVVSTAKHEFFGVSVLEAVYCGCFPLVPDRLVYPEIYPLDSLYADLDELYKKLKQFCLQPSLAIGMRAKFDIDFERFSKDVLMPKYMEVLEVNKN